VFAFAELFAQVWLVDAEPSLLFGLTAVESFISDFGITALVFVANTASSFLKFLVIALFSAALTVLVEPAPRRPVTNPIPANSHCLPSLYIL
jgi:hypothetical protein